MKFFTLSLGCKVNKYELDAVEELFINNQYQKDDNNPDVFIINTCSVTSMADKKSRQMIHRARHNNPSLKCLIVMGCYSQVNADEALKAGADVVLGAKYRNEAYQLASEFISSKKKIIKIDDNVRHFDYETFDVVPNINETRAYVKIQDGCDNFCSYCIIPYARGNSRSRNKDEIVHEIDSLVQKGFKEVVLAGIHTGGYHYVEGSKEYRLSNLIDEIFTKVPSLYRLRISSIEESEIDEGLLNLIAKEKRLAAHLHIPIQSGSEAILKAMHRKYSTKDFISKVQAIRKVAPDIAITTDVIVGFPGESEQNFAETVDFIKQVNFAELHVFPFSSRAHTLAAKMSGQIPPEIKKKRVEELIKLSNKLNMEYRNKFFGKKIDVLFEDYDSSDKKYRGHTSNYIEIRTKSDVDLRGKIVSVVYNAKL